MSAQRNVWSVCLVEDDAWIRTFLRDVLVDQGYVVYEAADGRTALRLVQEQPPDLILLDLAMPDVTGLDVLRALKRNRRTRPVPIVVMSAYTRVLSAEDVALVASVIRKPLVIEDLLDEIRRTLGQQGSSTQHS